MGFIFRTIGFLVVAAVVVAGVLIVLSTAGSPKPSCADGAVATSKAAEDRFNSKWNSFASALSRGEAATVTLTEEELTSRGARYLLDSNVPAKNLQVHLCAGQGRGQAAMSMELLGRPIDVVATGHLQLPSANSRVAVDSMQIGSVPEQVASWAANTILAVANIPVPQEIREVTTTSTAATLKGQK